MERPGQTGSEHVVSIIVRRGWLDHVACAHPSVNAYHELVIDGLTGVWESELGQGRVPEANCHPGQLVGCRDGRKDLRRW